MTRRLFASAGRFALIVAFTAGLVAGCGTLGPKAGGGADLMPTAAVSPNATQGSVTFTPLEHGVRVAGEIRGMAPGTEHGMHIHEKGDCSNNGEAAGGHFNPAGGTHGKFASAGSHSGDLPSLVADANGSARFSVEVHSISLTEGVPGNVIGRSLVIHRDRDDFTTQPSGNSGPRIACALITRR